MAIFAFRNSARKRGIPIDKFECIVGQFAQVVLHGFVGTMDGSIQRGIVEVNPIGFVRSGLNDSVGGKGEGVRIIGVGVGFSERDIRCVGRGDTIIAVRLRRIVFCASCKKYKQ